MNLPWSGVDLLSGERLDAGPVPFGPAEARWVKTTGANQI